MVISEFGDNIYEEVLESKGEVARSAAEPFPQVSSQGLRSAGVFFSPGHIQLRAVPECFFSQKDPGGAKSQMDFPHYITLSLCSPEGNFPLDTGSMRGGLGDLSSE